MTVTHEFVFLFFRSQAGNTATHLAAKYGFADLLPVFVEAGAKLEEKNLVCLITRFNLENKVCYILNIITSGAQDSLAFGS